LAQVLATARQNSEKYWGIAGSAQESAQIEPISSLTLPGVLLAMSGCMNPHTSHTNGRDTVVIIGGKGGLEARYREAVERSGYNFRYYEERVPTKLAPATARIALVIVMVTMVSHPLMTRARELAGNHARIVYLKSPSISAVRQTVASQSGTTSLLSQSGAA
jgi:hypothetical protein